MLRYLCDCGKGNEAGMCAGRQAGRQTSKVIRIATQCQSVHPSIQSSNHQSFESLPFGRQIDRPTHAPTDDACSSDECPLAPPRPGKIQKPLFSCVLFSSELSS